MGETCADSECWIACAWLDRKAIYRWWRIGSRCTIFMIQRNCDEWMRTWIMCTVDTCVGMLGVCTPSQLKQCFCVGLGCWDTLCVYHIPLILVKTLHSLRIPIDQKVQRTGCIDCCEHLRSKLNLNIVRGMPELQLRNLLSHFSSFSSWPFCWSSRKLNTLKWS
jgi:hypothetical protein